MLLVYKFQDPLEKGTSQIHMAVGSLGQWDMLNGGTAGWQQFWALIYDVGKILCRVPCCFLWRACWAGPTLPACLDSLMHSHLNLQTKPVDPTVDGGAQVQQVVNIECISDFTEAPVLNIQFR